MINTTMKKVVLYPGRFQPMLPHHAEVYKHLVAQFPDADVYIATSNKVEAPKSPFDAKEKTAIMTQLHDIPEDKILIVRSPYNAQEYKTVFDMENTVAIFAVGGKDMDNDPRFSFKPKKDGSPGYLQKINTISDGEMPMTQRGYVYSAPTVSNGNEAASASAFRNSISNSPDIDTAKTVFTNTFGKFDEKVFTLVYDNIIGTKMSESLDILRKLAGLSEAPVEFKPGKGKMDYEPKINRRDQADSDARPAQAAASNPDTATFTDIAPDAMISVDTNKPINSKGRFNSIANMVPANKDPNDPQVKKELFIRLMSKSPAFLLGEINARLGTDDESLAASDRLSAIMKQVEGGSIMSLPEDEREWTLKLIKNALLNMDLHRAGKGDQEEFGEPDPEENMPEESVDLSNIRGEYGVEEAEKHYVEQYDWKCEKCGHENVFGMTQQEADEYIENWERENGESGESGESQLDWNMNVIGQDSGMHRGQKCVNCGAIHESVKSPVEEAEKHYVEQYDWDCEKCEHENVFGMTQQEANEYIKNWERENPEAVANGESGQSQLDWNMNVIGQDSGMHRGQQCVNCGAISESVKSAVDETATNALNAALAELRSLAGL